MRFPCMVAAVLWLNEALAACGSAVTPLSARFQLSEKLASERLLSAGARDSLEKVMGNMSLGTALALLRQQPSVPSDLMLIVQQLFGTAASRGASTDASGRFLGHDGATGTGAAPPSAEKLAETRDMLNRLAEEARRKLDIEQVKCSEYDNKQLEMVKQTRVDMAAYSALAAGASEKIMAAGGDAERISKMLPQLAVGLEKDEKKCTSGIAALKTKKQMLEHDLDVMVTVFGKASCGGSAALLQCQGAARKVLFTTFRQGVLRNALSSIEDPFSKRILQDGLAQVYDEANASESRVSQAALVAVMEERSTSDADPLPRMEGRSENDKKAGTKCSMKDSPNCDVMQDKFLMMQAGIANKVQETKDELTLMDTHCEDAKTSTEAQISDYETRQGETQSALALATKVVNENEEQSRMKSQQLATLVANQKETSDRCKGNVRALEDEICGTRKIRTQLLRMSGIELAVVDCEVSEWQPGQCNVTCAGGEEVMTRSVMSPPANGGAKCPPQSAKRRCNDVPCPINCQLSDWSSFTSCSAQCGGGIRRRERIVLTVPKHGGSPCGANTESQTCKAQSCAKDCILGDWTAWSPCPKVCGGGMQEQLRPVGTPLMGQGKCPAEDADVRRRYKPCNDFPCDAGNKTTLECTSKLDVILLLDGSGSIGEAGWKAEVNAAEQLVKAFRGGDEFARMALLVYSGPHNWKSYLRCTQGAGKGEQAPNMRDECGIDWISHLTADIPSVAAKIPSLEWPKKTTLTSGALMAAASELRQGRRSAKSVVIVVTDARPMNPGMVSQASQKIRNQARLIWIPVTKFAPLKEVRMWASNPKHSNVLQVDDFETLEEPSTVSELIADICPSVEPPQKPPVVSPLR